MFYCDLQNGLPYDSRLYTIYLSKEERDKHIIYTNMDDRDLVRYVENILELVKHIEHHARTCLIVRKWCERSRCIFPLSLGSGVK